MSCSSVGLTRCFATRLGGRRPRGLRHRPDARENDLLPGYLLREADTFARRAEAETTLRMFEVGLDRLLRGRPVWRRLRTLYLWTTLVRPACLAWRLRAAERAYAPDGEGFASVDKGSSGSGVRTRRGRCSTSWYSRLDLKPNYFAQGQSPPFRFVWCLTSPLNRRREVVSERIATGDARRTEIYPLPRQWRRHLHSRQAGWRFAAA